MVSVSRASIAFMLITFLFLCGTLSACTQNNEIEIVASPNVLNLESSGGVFTIHAGIRYDTDQEVKVYLNNDMDSVSILSTFADSRGDLVVKCDILDVKEEVSEGSVTIKLTVRTADGILHSGTDTIDIISTGK
jgi:hypothetical protein